MLNTICPLNNLWPVSWCVPGIQGYLLTSCPSLWLTDLIIHKHPTDYNSGSCDYVSGRGNKHEVYAAAFGSHFYDYFLHW